MLTTYDFLLPADTLQSIETALKGAGATQSSHGTWVWSFPAGDARIVPLCEGAKTVGMEVQVPLKENATLVTAVLHASINVAEHLGLRLVDIQLNRVVQHDAESSVCNSYLSHARYAGEYAGLSDALGATTPATSTGLRTYIFALLIFLAALYLTFIFLNA